MIVLGNALTVQITLPQKQLCLCIPGDSCPAQASRRDLMILMYANSVAIAEADSLVCRRMALIARFTEPAERLLDLFQPFLLFLPILRLAV